MEIVRCCGIVCILILAGLKDLPGFWKVGSRQQTKKSCRMRQDLICYIKDLVSYKLFTEVAVFLALISLQSASKISSIEPSPTMSTTLSNFW